MLAGIAVAWQECLALSQAIVCDVLKQPRFLLGKGMTQLKTEAVVNCRVNTSSLCFVWGTVGLLSSALSISVEQVWLSQTS